MQAKDYVGLSEHKAQEIATVKGLKPRIVERDGRKIVHKTDAKSDRINFTVSGGKITKAVIG